MENRLTNLLFEAEGYNPLIRPVKNISEVIQVNVTFTIVQLLHVVRKYFILLVESACNYISC